MDRERSRSRSPRRERSRSPKYSREFLQQYTPGPYYQGDMGTCLRFAIARLLGRAFMVCFDLFGLVGQTVIADPTAEPTVLAHLTPECITVENFGHRYLRTLLDYFFLHLHLYNDREGRRSFEGHTFHGFMDPPVSMLFQGHGGGMTARLQALLTASSQIVDLCLINMPVTEESIADTNTYLQRGFSVAFLTDNHARVCTGIDANGYRCVSAWGNHERAIEYIKDLKQSFKDKKFIESITFVRPTLDHAAHVAPRPEWPTKWEALEDTDSGASSLGACLVEIQQRAGPRIKGLAMDLIEFSRSMPSSRCSVVRPVPVRPVPAPVRPLGGHSRKPLLPMLRAFLIYVYKFSSDEMAAFESFIEDETAKHGSITPELFGKYNMYHATKQWVANMPAYRNPQLPLAVRNMIIHAINVIMADLVEGPKEDLRFARLPKLTPPVYRINVENLLDWLKANPHNVNAEAVRNVLKSPKFGGTRRRLRFRSRKTKARKTKARP